MGQTLAGRSLFLFGLLSFVGSIWAMLWHGRFVLDLGGPVVMWLGLRVAHGSRSAAKWAAVMMAIYLGGVVLLVLAGLLDWGLKVNGEQVRPEELPWVVACLAPIGIWAAANMGLTIAWLLAPKSGSTPVGCQNIGHGVPPDRR